MGDDRTPITVARGDGIGPEIMDATLRILEAGGARLDINEIQIGEAVYEAGNSAGITDEALDSLRRTKVFLKAPITTPQGGGFKSLNVTVRKTFGLYANIRPCVSYAPFIATKHPGMDVVIIRENEEDLYAGIEHQQTDEVVQCLKLISRPGCERIVRYAFEYAKVHDRAKVTAFTKDNIMKLTDGLFHKVFDEVSLEYPDIEAEHWIVDIGAAKLADDPASFDVVVLPNLYGDILSDVAAQIAGSVGLAGSANIGAELAMFEAIHGSAPRRAGQKGPNPYCPNDTILAGTIKADDEIVMGGNGNVVLEIAFGSDRPVMERTEGLVTAGGAEIARWGKEIPAGVPVVFEGSLDDVLYDAYHMGLVSFSTKSELGHLDITVNQEYSLAEIYVNGRFVAVRPIARD